MNRFRHGRLSLFAGLILTLILTTVFVSPRPVRAEQSDLTLVYSNDVRGETEPCG